MSPVALLAPDIERLETQHEEMQQQMLAVLTAAQAQPASDEASAPKAKSTRRNTAGEQGS